MYFFLSAARVGDTWFGMYTTSSAAAEWGHCRSWSCYHDTASHCVFRGLLLVKNNLNVQNNKIKALVIDVISLFFNGISRKIPFEVSTITNEYTLC